MGTVKYNIVNQDGKEYIEEIHRVIVHRSLVSEEDLDNYVSRFFQEWKESEPGKYVMENAVKMPMWQAQFNIDSYCNEIVIIAELKKKHLSEFYLRWGKNGDS